MAEIIECYPLRLKYTNGRGRTAKNRGSYITKCIRNREKRLKARTEKEKLLLDETRNNKGGVITASSLQIKNG